MLHCGLAAAGARKEADVVRVAAVLDTVSGGAGGQSKYSNHLSSVHYTTLL